MSSITVAFEPSDHRAFMAHAQRKVPFLDQPLCSGKVLRPCVVLMFSEAPYDHDMLCDCIVCIAAHGRPEERVYEVEQEIAGSNLERKRMLHPEIFGEGE